MKCNVIKFNDINALSDKKVRFNKIENMCRGESDEWRVRTLATEVCTRHSIITMVSVLPLKIFQVRNYHYL